MLQGSRLLFHWGEIIIPWGLQLASFSWTGRVFPQLNLPWEKFSTLQLLLAHVCDVEKMARGCRSWECWGAPLSTQASESWCHLHIRAILALLFDCVITISLVLISFQIVQERLQAWVSQWSCFLLVNRSNSLEKKFLWRKLCKWSCSKYFWYFHQENHTVKALLLLYT